VKGRAWLEIDLNKLRENIRFFKKNYKAKFNFVVKANAYGHGVKKIVEVASQEGVDMFSVATIEEALEILENGTKKPILVFSPVSSLDNLKYDKDNLIRLALVDRNYIRVFEKIAKKLNRKLVVHIDVDTGMNRTGIRWEDFRNVLYEILNNPYMRLEGVFTHFATAGEDVEFANYQLRIFKEKVLPLIPSDIKVIRHAANTAALVNLKGVEFDMIRPGVGVYGLYAGLNTKQIVSFKAKVLQVKNVRKGEGVGYGHSFKAPSDMKIAVLTAGYADGYPRQLSNKASVLIKGTFRKITGFISMDLMMVDVSSPPEVNIEDEAILIGGDGRKEVKISELAEMLNTIPYDIVCRIGPRVPRVYIE